MRRRSCRPREGVKAAILWMAGFWTHQVRLSSRALGEQDATSSARRHCTDLLLGGFGGFLGASGGF